MKQINSSHEIVYTVVTSNEMIVAAKHLHHDVYLQMGYLSKPYADRIIPFEYDDSSIYIAAIDGVNEVVGTIRLSIGMPFNTFKEWSDNFYPSCEGLIKDVMSARSFEIGALAVKKSYSSQKISWGLYKASYQVALALNLSYGVISMDYRALRSMEMLGWFVVKIGQPMDYYGSLTIPGVMPVHMQPDFVSAKNKTYQRYLCA